MLTSLLAAATLVAGCNGARAAADDVVRASADDVARAIGRSSQEVTGIAEQRAAQQGRTSDEVIADWARVLQAGAAAAQEVPKEVRGVACGFAMDLLLASEPTTRASAYAALQKEVFSLNLRYAATAFVKDLDEALAAYAQGDSRKLFGFVLQTTSCQLAAL